MRVNSVAIAVFVSLNVAWSSARLAGGPQDSPAPSDPARDEAILKRVCSGCHEADNVRGSRRSREQWEQVVEKMSGEGARMTDPEYEAVMRILLGRYGRVNVNSDRAPDLASVLGLSAEDAERIVAFRTANGKFADFDALLKVPDVDASRLTELRVAIVF